MSTGLVIFDCDGVLVDSERISLRLQAQALTEIGLPTTYEDCVRDYAGIGMTATITLVERRLGRPLPNGWLQGIEASVEKAFTRELKPVPGVPEVLDAIHYPTCIASSGTHAKMRLTLGITGLYERFAGRTYSVQDVSRGKPYPDLFLHAARAMAAPPPRCLVIEDSAAGVQAARAAGMSVLGYAADTRADHLSAADGVFTDMRELPSLVTASLGEPISE
jgi:HAD superfamily hydrolase (TIGR01509 family)